VPNARGAQEVALPPKVAAVTIQACFEPDALEMY